MTETDHAEFRAKRNAFIKRSFRDTADRDYISARILNRNRLSEQFLWQALQCIEKYLKAILLFNNKGTKHLNHNISQALNDALSIKGLGMTVTKRTSNFVDSINQEGPNRYFSYPRFGRGKDLLDLDHSVWQIRRFCDDYFFPHENELFRRYDEEHLNYVRGDQVEKQRAKFRLEKSGFLEKVLDTDKYSMLRQNLVWKNFYFGAKNKHTIINSNWETWSQPSNFIYPELVGWVEENVKMPKDVLDAMRKRI